MLGAVIHPRLTVRMEGWMAVFGLCVYNACASEDLQRYITNACKYARA